MITNIQVEEIKKLIEDGFDLELISFELDIPMKEIEQCKLDLEKDKKSNLDKAYSEVEIIGNKNKPTNTKMEQIRERYRKLYFRSNKSGFNNRKELSKQDIEVIDLVIAKIEKVVEEIKSLSKNEKRKGADEILAELKKIENYQLTIEQAEKLRFLMQSEVLEKLKLNPSDKIDLHIDKTRRIIDRKLIDAVYIAQYQTEEIEELKILSRKLTPKMQENNQMVVRMIKGEIESKISKINQQKAIDRIRNDITANIELIIKELAKGTLNIQTANEIVEAEAKRRVEIKPKTRFALTEEQEKRQILIQINTFLREKPEKYHIQNPEITIMQIQELCGVELEQAIGIVVKNLTGIKDFETAKEVLKKFSTEDKESVFIRKLRNEVRNDEISDMVLKGINMNGTEEEEKAYFELIEKGLKKGNVKLDAINLGKSQDGLRNITLADIWTDENKKGNDHKSHL